MTNDLLYIIALTIIALVLIVQTIRLHRAEKSINLLQMDHYSNLDRIKELYKRTNEIKDYINTNNSNQLEMDPPKVTKRAKPTKPRVYTMPKANWKKRKIVTDALRKEIFKYRDRHPNESQKAIAKNFNLSQTTVSRILRSYI